MLSSINLNEFHHDINLSLVNRYVVIKVIGEVVDENTHGQTDLKKLENLITIDY